MATICTFHTTIQNQNESQLTIHYLDGNPFCFCIISSNLFVFIINLFYFVTTIVSFFLFFIFYFLPLWHRTRSLYSTVFLCPPSQMWEPVIPYRNKMKNNEYESAEHVDSDLALMFENAKRYNVPHSSIYKRALKLQHIQQVSLSASLSWLRYFLKRH